MRIAELAPLWKPVPPRAYGGVETVVSALTEELVTRGHSVTLFASKGSQTRGTLVEVIPRPLHEIRAGFSWDAIPAEELLSLDELIARRGAFDIVHNHLGPHMLVPLRLLGIPVVTTYHSSLPPDFPEVAERVRDFPFVSISDAQRELAPSLNFVATVHHGLPLDAFSPRLDGDGEFFLFVGTLSFNKGVDRAVRAALALGEKLVIAGEIRESDRPFLEREVFPHVDGKHIVYAGEVGMREKADLFRRAKAHVLPMRWREAFGLTLIESLASGTPVIVWDSGSPREIVRDGVTGFLVHSEEELVARMARVSDLSRRACREDAEVRFSADRMAEDYEEVFAHVRARTSA